MVLLAERDGVTEVLKVVRDGDHAERLCTDLEVLARRRHHAIIHADGIIEIGSHMALRHKPGLLSHPGRGPGLRHVRGTTATRSATPAVVLAEVATGERQRFDTAAATLQG